MAHWRDVVIDMNDEAWEIERAQLLRDSEERRQRRVLEEALSARPPLSGAGSPQPEPPKVQRSAPDAMAPLHALADEIGATTGRIERELKALVAEQIGQLRAEYSVEVQLLRNEVAALRRELNDVHARSLNLSPFFEGGRVSH